MILSIRLGGRLATRYNPPMTWASSAVWTGLLASLQAGTSDLALRPERWETRAVLSSVENILRDPASGPAAVDALGARIAGASGSAGLIAAGFESLGVTPAGPTPAPEASAPPGLPEGLSRPVGLLVARLTAALADQKRAVASLTPEERARSRRAVAAAVGDDAFAPVNGEDFDAAYQRVREKYRDRFLGIIQRYQQAPIFRIQSPALHALERIS